MRKIILLLLTLSLIDNFVYSQSGWVWQNPLPTGNSLKNVKYLNSTTGFIVGNYGTILRTTNNGLNWISLNSPTNKHLNGLDFLSASEIAVVGEQGAIYKSGDLGNTWIDISVSVNIFLNDIDFVNASTGIAGGSKILKTTNGGNNWSEQPFTGTEINSIQFLNINTSMAIGRNGTGAVILKTTNGGNNWITQTSPINSYLSNAFFSNLNTGYAVTGGQNNIIKTTDGGNNWFISYSGGSGSGALFSIWFSDDNTGLVTGDRGSIGRTTNGGTNWSFVSNFPSSPYVFFTSVTFSAPNYASIASSSGLIFASTDNGLTWVNQNKETIEHLNGVFFTDLLTGYVSGANGVILKTINGGLSWANQTSNAANYLNDIYFVNSNTGIVVGHSGIIRKTTNGGINWITINSNTSLDIYSVQFCNQNTGIAVGQVGLVLKTSDSGSNWVQLNSGGAFTLTDVAMPDVNNIYIVGYGRRIKSTDGGNSWTILYSCSGKGCTPYYDVQFFNSLTGYLLGGLSSSLYKTTNGGLNFTTTSAPYRSFHFIDLNNGIAVSNSSIGRTTNGGTNWINTDISSISTNFQNVFMNDLNFATIVGSYGAIMKTSTGGFTFINANTNEIPSAFLLHQNYPNPFNPATNIKFDIPKSSFVKLIVYDVLGREITVLVNEQLKAGTYQADWNASDFPSGVYFYKLQTETFIETKKMALIK